MKPRGPLDRMKDKMTLKIAAAFLKAKRCLKTGDKIMGTGDTAPAGTIYSFTMKSIDGREKPLADYKGRVLLIVNTASLCGLTPQYEGLETLFKRYKTDGFSILAFPANDFGAQEPGEDSQIREFCQTRYSTSFDLFSKISVKGSSQHPLYNYLTRKSGHNGEISWNFEKFLLSRQGVAVGRWNPETDPLDRSLTQKIEELLFSRPAAAASSAV